VLSRKEHVASQVEDPVWRLRIRNLLALNTLLDSPQGARPRGSPDRPVAPSARGVWFARDVRQRRAHCGRLGDGAVPVAAAAVAPLGAAVPLLPAAAQAPGDQGSRSRPQGGGHAAGGAAGVARARVSVAGAGGAIPEGGAVTSSVGVAAPGAGAALQPPGAPVPARSGPPHTL
ncbi:unnamed protein product, partial [Ixodes pacificus]